MLHQRETAWSLKKTLGQLPAFIVDWFKYLDTLTWNQEPCYATLEGIIESVLVSRPHKRRYSNDSCSEGQPAAQRRREDSCTVCEDSTLLQLGSCEE